MFVLLMNWRSGPAEHSFRNRWLDYLCPYLFSLDHFTDDVYALEVWGCDCRSDLLKPEHSGVLRALLSIELAWHVFFQVRCILLGLNPPRIITVYAGDIVDENGMVALPREAGRGESVLVVDGTATGTIGFSDEDIRAILSSRFGSGQRSLQSNSNASGQGQNEESFGRGLEGMRGLSGPIEALDGDSITISTAQGPLQAVVSNETVIVMTVTGMLEDLAPGIRVRVIGERGDDGIVAATFITIISEEIQGSPFGGFQRSATP